MPLSVFKKLELFARMPVVRWAFWAVLLVVSLVVGVLTYELFTGTDLQIYNKDLISLSMLLKINGVLLLVLLIALILRLVRLWDEWRTGTAGAKLQTRMVMIFSVLAVVPVILITVFSLIFFDLGIDTWFSQKIRNAVTGSKNIASLYLREHRGGMKTVALSMKNDLQGVPQELLQDKPRLSAVLEVHANVRDVTEAMIFTLDGQVKARYGLTAVLELEPILQSDIENAKQGDAVVLESSTGNRVRALIQLTSNPAVFLLVGRFIDPKIIANAESTTSAAVSFETLEREREQLKISFVITFLLGALLLLVVAIWLSFIFAKRLVAPIGELIMATHRVADGDYHARANIGGDDEIAQLGGAFDNMVGQLNTQRLELLQANQDIDRRRLFTEAVLSGVGSGIVSLDNQGQIMLSNKRSVDLLGQDLGDCVGQKLTEVCPLFGTVLEQVKTQPTAEEQIRLQGDKDGVILLVRATQQRHTSDGNHGESPQIMGYVLAFDDVSPLLSAQRQAAWSDVARRIAHEIKNPLTPIQLSAERLRRKYSGQISSDIETFETCTDTIIRQVADIGRLVDEFSSFARMPSAILQVGDFRQVCNQALALEKTAHPYIKYTLNLPDDAVWVSFDTHQMSQVLINLLQNAYEAIESADKLRDGRIALSVENASGAVTIRVVDNGIGFPTDGREKLLDPYVTTREQGTGLGLSIVSKIIQDHKGKLQLLSADTGGAIVEFTMPTAPTPESDTPNKQD